jgi:hypothetical protein
MFLGVVSLILAVFGRLGTILSIFLQLLCFLTFGLALVDPETRGARATAVIGLGLAFLAATIVVAPFLSQE